MRKFVLLATIVAAFAFAGNAGACNDLGFTIDIGRTNSTAVSAATIAGNGSVSAGLRMARLAQSQYHNGRQPCDSRLKQANYQYGIALDYLEDGLASAVRGDYDSAIQSVRTARRWMQRSTASLKLFNRG